MTLTPTLLARTSGQAGDKGVGTVLVAGAPTAQTPAVDGQNAVDVQNALLYGARAGGTFPTPPTSLTGPTGPQGSAAAANPGIGQQALSYGTVLGFGSVQTVSATPLGLPVPGTNCTGLYTPLQQASFLGATFVVTSGASNATGIVFQLRDGTSNLSVYDSPSYSFGTVNSVSVAQGNVVLNAGQPYYWTVKGTGTAAFEVFPAYTAPATTSTLNLSPGPDAALSTATAMSGTPVSLRLVGGNACIAYFRPLAPCVVWDVNVSNSGTAACNVQLLNQTGNVAVGSVSSPANTTQTFGPFGTSAWRLGANTTYLWRATGSSSSSNQLWLTWRVAQ